MIVSKPWTYSLTAGTLTISSSYGLNVLSILATDGSVIVTGSLTANGIPSEPITLLQGQAVTISAGSNNSLPLNGITITTAGTASLVGR